MLGDMLEYELPEVTAVRHVKEHVLWLRFSDGIEGEVDLSDGLRGPIFEPLRDPARFAEVAAEHGTIAWPNGADWAAETLYDRLRAAIGLDTPSFGDARRDEPAYIAGMPEVSRFYGIIIRMLANQHSPPHFHATYGEHHVSMTIEDGVVTGRFPARALRLVAEWGELHRDELLENWSRLRSGETPEPIAPLA
jgi:Domain of unknown function (DUF4160)/Protein of unknown function (DUF2442)